MGFSLAGAAGCQSARYVLKEQDRGVVAIPVDSLNWPVDHGEEAQKLMIAHFPQGYIVEREEEVVVGEVTRYHENSNNHVEGKHGRVVIQAGGVSGYTETVDKKERRISYRRATPAESRMQQLGLSQAK